MKDWVVIKFNAALVIIVDVLSSSSNLRIQIASQEHWARALYSDSHEDLEVLDCFLEFHEIGELPRKKM